MGRGKNGRLEERNWRSLILEELCWNIQLHAGGVTLIGGIN